MLTRRAFTLAASAVLVTGCSGRPPGAGVAARRQDPALLPQPNPGWDAWVASFKGRAAAQGIRQDVIDGAFRGAGFLPGVVERDRNQTEFKRSFEDYIAIVAPERKVAEGRAAFARNRATLTAIEGRYGVPAEIVAAIWGVESNFGQRRGDIGTVSALSTLAYDGRRGAFFEAQLIAALKILQAGDVTPDRMVGSWAGAMGHTQFIPTSYLQSAVDFTGDGRRDIWGEDPTDALASAAAYLAGAGWQRGASWAVEDPNGNLTPDAGGPSFRTGPNFRVIKRYNNSDSYALGVGHLADRIAGGGPLRQPFGPDRYGLTIDQRQDLQRRLTAAGFDTDGSDGVIGPKSRTAIAAYQRSRGLPATGDPSAALLASLG
ncbi:lytic murein transglycosylase [Jannaschia rubra]|uniref:Membrane-bound lytic murein transglycosylase B n=1 Tax=Jannaschia rubra TaxID=282197 RepID=A0A0M6XUE9_9RHOB|nr:lytic murein transglycosylase [Jannaschia rubra]CTQ33564.1 Membrane-bound lytic murein transglycosylase B precursor [Jannaschia rubra]SFG03969.1 lytic murein transglycosylase [Jannaschia rubra]